jgi:hypothetical protein
MIEDMQTPHFIRPLTEDERHHIQTGLRSKDAFVLRRCPRESINNFVGKLAGFEPADATFNPKDLGHLTPVFGNPVVEIGTRPDGPLLEAAMSFLDVHSMLPGAPIRLWIFKKVFEILARICQN